MYSGAHGIIGNGVHVPTHFYKVIYDPVNQDAIAFLAPHRKISKSDLPTFIVSVDEVERRSGFDFNNLLDDVVEDDIEDDVEEMNVKAAHLQDTVNRLELEIVVC